VCCGQCGAQVSGRPFCASCGSRVAAPGEPVPSVAQPTPVSGYPQAADPAPAWAPGPQVPPPVSAAPAPRLGRVGAVAGVALLAVTASGVGYFLGQSGGGSPDFPVSVASMASGEWGCTGDDLMQPLDISISRDAAQGTVDLSVSDEYDTDSVRVTQSGDADLIGVVGGLLDAMGEKGSISLSEEGSTPISLAWVISQERLEFTWFDGSFTHRAACTMKP
jgi:hypothetical protein